MKWCRNGLEEGRVVTYPLLYDQIHWIILCRLDIKIWQFESFMLLNIRANIPSQSQIQAADFNQGEDHCSYCLSLVSNSNKRAIPARLAWRYIQTMWLFRQLCDAKASLQSNHVQSVLRTWDYWKIPKTTGKLSNAFFTQNFSIKPGANLTELKFDGKHKK